MLLQKKTDAAEHPKVRKKKFKLEIWGKMLAETWKT
jgi:hypothetical protein